MSTEDMRLLMEAAKGYVEVDENFITEPDAASVDAPVGDSFRDEEPAQPITVVANVDIPSMYMNAGDELYLEPTNNQGEAYSEENGLTYEWDFIFHLIRDRNMLDFKEDTEVAFDEDSTDFKHQLQNPEWDERREYEIKKRAGHLAKIARTGQEDDLYMARVKTPRGNGTIYSINNLVPTDPEHLDKPTVSVRLDTDQGGAGGGTQQYRMLLSTVVLLPEEDSPVKEGIAGDAAKDVYRKATGRVTDKEGLERMVRIYVEQAISRLELGLQMRNENDPELLVKTIGTVRSDLIELQKWIRERK